MSNYVLRTYDKKIGLYVEGKLVATHDRTSKQQDIDLSLKQRFGGKDYTEVAEKQKSLPKEWKPAAAQAQPASKQAHIKQ